MRKITIILIITAVLLIIGIIGYSIYTVYDWDYDGIPTNLENEYGTDPYKKDTDNDGISDYDEIYVYKTNPLLKDSDNDGLSDLDELSIYLTNPLVNDTDGDKLSDYSEVNEYRTNPNSFDSDNDGLSDSDEILVYKTDPLNSDTDSDGLKDGDEIKVYLTNPFTKDTDGDSWSDYDEIFNYKTSPLLNDTDNDGWIDSIDLYPLGNIVLNITIVEWSEIVFGDKDNPGDPYIVLTIAYIINQTVYRSNHTVQFGLNISYLTNYSFIIDIPDYIPAKVVSIDIIVCDNDTLDGLSTDYQYYIAYSGETPIKRYGFVYTLFTIIEKSTRGEDALLILRIETIRLTTVKGS